MNHEDYQPAGGAGRDSNVFFKLQRKAISARLEKANVALTALEKKIAQLLLDFGLLVDIYDVPTILSPDGIPRPTEFTEHRRLYDFYRNAEWASYFASIVLLVLLTHLNFAFAWELKILIVAAVFVVVWKLFPALLAAAFNVKTKVPESIKPVKWTLLVGGVLAVGGLVGFSLTRASDEVVGLIAMIYQNALTVAELGFGICAANFNILKKFYSWSLLAATDYDNWTEQANKLRAEHAELSAQLSKQSSKVITPETEEGENHVN
jgi:hypothetical protein